MSSHAATKIDQKEYLKRYLSGDKEKKKKKKHKKEKKNVAPKVLIIDDDAYADNNEDLDEELLFGGEDAPQIVGEYVDVRPMVDKWKSIAVKDEPVDEVTPNGSNENDLWGVKEVTRKIKVEFSPSRSKRTDSKLEKDISPPRKSRKQSESRDHTPVRRIKEEPISPEQRIKQEPRSSSREIEPHTSSRSRDQSPPRRKKERNRADENSSNSRARDHSTDLSPPRRKPRSRSRDKSLERRRRRKNSPDQSPPRRRTGNHSTDLSPPRRKQRSRSQDKSLERRRPHKDSPDQSPPRRRARNQFSDLSPTRRKQRSRSRDKDLEGSRRRKDSPDQLPPRRRDQISASTASSSRHQRASADLSPSKRRQRSRSRGHSPRRNRKHNSNDLPPPQNIKREERSSTHLSPPRKTRWAKPEPVNSPSPPPTHAKQSVTKTLDGKKAGLQDAHSLKAETELRRRQEDLLYEKMSRDASGRDAEVQVRSTGRRGKRARDAAAEDPEEQKRKEEQEQKKKELYDRWGKGLKQVEAQRARQAEMVHEAAKPLARYADDEDLDRHLREQEHPDDPMLEYMRQKRKKKQQVSGAPVVPKYEGSYPENRFGIRPGYRWDGVDRSNGYERKWFDKQNEKHARQDEAYKYSIEDM